MNILTANPNGNSRVLNLRRLLHLKNIFYNQFATIISDIFAIPSKAIYFPSGKEKSRWRVVESYSSVTVTLRDQGILKTLLKKIIIG